MRLYKGERRCFWRQYLFLHLSEFFFRLLFLSSTFPLIMLSIFHSFLYYFFFPLVSFSFLHFPFIFVSSLFHSLSLFFFMFLSFDLYFLFLVCFFLVVLSFLFAFFLFIVCFPLHSMSFRSLFVCSLFVRLKVQVSITHLGDMVNFTFRLLCLLVRLYGLLCVPCSNSGRHAEKNVRNSCQ